MRALLLPHARAVRAVREWVAAGRDARLTWPGAKLKVGGKRLQYKRLQCTGTSTARTAT
jgi:hypothetical protein